MPSKFTRNDFFDFPMYSPSFMCCIDSIHLARQLLTTAKETYLDPFEYDSSIHPDCRIIGDFNRLRSDLDDIEEKLSPLYRDDIECIEADEYQHIVDTLIHDIYMLDCDIQCFYQHCKLPLDHLPLDYFYQVYAQCRVCFDLVNAVVGFHSDSEIPF